MSLEVQKGVKQLDLYDVDHGVVMEPMQGKLASSQFDFRYTEQFCIPAVTSGFFSSCDSVVGDSLEFSQANRGSLMFDWENAVALDTIQGNRASSRREGNISWVFSSCRRNLGYILELQPGCPFESLVCSLKSGTCLGMRDNSGM